MTRFLKNAPKILVDRYNDPDDSFYQDDLLKKLLTPKNYGMHHTYDMGSVWEKLDKRVGENYFLYIIFVIEVQKAALGPNKWESMTSEERKDWIRKVTGKCNELTRLFIDGPFDFTIDVCQDMNPCTDNELPLHRLLSNISKDVENIPLGNTPIVKRPNTKKATQRYFVRSLGKYLREEFNQPLYEVIEGTANVVFVEETITKDYVAITLRKTE